MKTINIFFLIFMLLPGYSLFAQYNYSVTTNQSELIFTVKDGLDVVSLGSDYNKEVGAPQLPVKILKYLVPIDKQVLGITVTNTNSTDISGNYDIYPVQEPVPTNQEAIINFTSPDESIYNSSTPYPGISCELSDDLYPMGYQVITVMFYPVQYTPTLKTLSLFTNISFTINVQNTTPVVIRPRKQSSKRFELTRDFVKSLIANPEVFNATIGGALQIVQDISVVKKLNLSWRPDPASDMPEYIIITNNALSSAFQQIADWKIQKGVPAMVVTTEQIDQYYSGFDLAEKIRNYLRDVYSLWGQGLYVLLGGDVGIVPVRYANQSKEKPSLPFRETDLYYSSVSSNDNWNLNGNSIIGENAGIYSIPTNSDLTIADYSPVLFIGRIPANSPEQVNVMKEKIFTYEQLSMSIYNPNVDINYVKNLLVMSALNTYYIDGIADAFPPGINKNKLYNSYGGSPQLNHNSAVDMLSSGDPTNGKMHLVYHMDHSTPQTMGTSSTSLNQNISCSDVASFTNKPEFQIILSSGCEPNHFAINSISKSFLSNQNGGCVAFIGNSWEGYGDYYTDFDVLRNKLFDNTTGTLLNIGNIFQFMVQSPAVYLYFHKRNINFLGDPEMKIWTNEVHTLTVSNPSSITVNPGVTTPVAITVSGIDYASPANPVEVKICLMKAGEVYARPSTTLLVTSSSTTQTFDISPETAGYLKLTVMASNYLPVIRDIPVTITGPHLYVSNQVLDDDKTGGSIGNSNGQADAGETIDLNLTVSNSGSTNVPNASATLNWAAQGSSQYSNMITIVTSGSVSYGAINAGASATRTLRIQVDKNAPDNSLTHFTLSINDGLGHIFDYPFEIVVSAPILIKQENYVTTTNGDNVITNGEDVSMNINLHNLGAGTLTGGNPSTFISATLTSAFSGVNVTQQYADIAANETKYNTLPFNFTATSDYSGESFTLAVTNEYNKTYIFGFSLTPPADESLTPITHIGYQNSIEVLWAPSAFAISGYNIYRADLQTGPYIKINDQLLTGTTSYLDDGLAILTEYYYKICTVDAFGNESAKVPTDGYPASTINPYHTNWPVSTIALYGGRCEGHPIAFDVFNDGNKEIFFPEHDMLSTGVKGGIMGFKHDATRWFYEDQNQTNMSGFKNLNAVTMSAPAIADIDNDGNYEVVVSTTGGTISNNTNKIISVEATTDANGDYKADYTWIANPDDLDLAGQGVTLCDINNDNKLEIFHQGGWSYSPYSVVNYLGQACYPNSNPPGSQFVGNGMPVVFDINNDGSKEIITASQGGLYIWKTDGTDFILATNPVKGPLSSANLNGRTFDVPPVVVDLDNDGDYEIVFSASLSNNTSRIMAIHHNGSYVTGWSDIDNNHLISIYAGTGPWDTWMCPGISVGDVNGDGFPEVVTVGSDPSLSASHLYIWSHTGTQISNITLPAGVRIESSAPLIVDADADHNDLEIVFSFGGKIYAYKINGSSVKAIVR